MPANDRHTVAFRRLPQAAQHWLGVARAGRPQRIDDGRRAPPMAAMSEMFTIAPHQPANARIARDELVHEAFDGKQQVAVTIGNSGAVVPYRNGALR